MIKKYVVKGLVQGIGYRPWVARLAEELNIESAMGLSEQGIDVFNANDSFFSDLCHKYDN